MFECQQRQKHVDTEGGSQSAEEPTSAIADGAKTKIDFRPKVSCGWTAKQDRSKAAGIADPC